MWNKRTGAKGKCLSKVVSSKTYYSQALFDISFQCVNVLEKGTKMSKDLSFRHTCNVEEV